MTQATSTPAGGATEAWRTALAIGIGAGAIERGISIVRGVAVGAAAGALAYTAIHAGTNSWSWLGFAGETGLDVEGRAALELSGSCIVGDARGTQP